MKILSVLRMHATCRRLLLGLKSMAVGLRLESSLPPNVRGMGNRMKTLGLVSLFMPQSFLLPLLVLASLFLNVGMSKLTSSLVALVLIVAFSQMFDSFFNDRLHPIGCGGVARDCQLAEMAELDE